MSTAQVQWTNDSSTLSKQSMVERGYFKDDYISSFINRPSRRSPLINIGYFVRATIIDSFLRSFMEKLGTSKAQILSLGAGFDTSFFRIFEKLKNVVYYEIDLLEVVQSKIECIVNNRDLSSKLKNWKVLTSAENNKLAIGLLSDTYIIITQDLSEVIQVQEKLLSAGFSLNVPTLLFSECAITYMDEIKSTQLIKWAADSLPYSVFMTYEQISPDDGFGQFMKEHFVKIQTPLKSLDVYKMTEDLTQRYLSCGWTHCNSLRAWDVYSNLLTPDEQKTVLCLEPFDEWEEWHLKCCHYTITIASKLSTHHLVKPFLEKIKVQKVDIIYKGSLELTSSSCEWSGRFGHCIVPIEDFSSNIIIGGFGPSENDRHTRVKEVIIGCGNFEKAVKTGNNSIAWDSMYHRCCYMAVSGKQSKFVMYGGRSSPSKCTNTDPLIITAEKINDDKDVYRKGYWRISAANIDITGNDRPCPRYRHSMEVVDNIMIVYGGRTPNLEVLDDLWTLDVSAERKKWKKLQQSKDDNYPSGRFSHSSCILPNSSKMIISGGLDWESKVLADIWEYDSGRWNNLENVVGMLPRYSHTSHAFISSTGDNLLIMVGGVNTTNCQPGIGIVNLRTIICMEYSFHTCIPDMPPIMLHNHCSVMSLDRKTIDIVGGGGNCFSFGTHLNKYIYTLAINL